MIIVTGATGRLGSRVVSGLLDRAPAGRIGVAVRDASRASALAAQGVRVRPVDAAEPVTYAHAFKGATVVLVVSAPLLGEAGVAANRTVIDAAWAAGAERVVYTSHQAAAHDSLFLPQPSHAATQDYLLASGRPFTALRNGFYASTIENYLPGALATGTLTLPADGPVSWTAHDDLAEAAVAALLGTEIGTEAGVGTGPEELDGITAPLYATEAIDFDRVAEILTELTGTTIKRVVVDDDQWRASAIERGVPEVVADIQLSMFRASRAGEFAVTDPTLAKVIGRPPLDARATLAPAVVATRD